MQPPPSFRLATVLVLAFLASAGCLGDGNPSSDERELSAPPEESPPPAQEPEEAAEDAGEDPTPPQESPPLAVSTVCFTATQTPNGQPTPLTGTRWMVGPADEERRAVVLLTGGFTDRWMFDLDIGDGSPSIVRVLASAGYVVFSYDHLGVGESPYAGSGNDITFDQLMLAAHDVVDQVKTGTYTEALGDCTEPASGSSPFASPHVVMGGQSLGGFATMGYVTRWSDVEGAIFFDTSSMGFGKAFTVDTAALCVTPQMVAGKDHVDLCPGPEGYSPTCIKALFYLPAASREIAEDYCSKDSLLTAPAGIFQTMAQHLEEIHAGIPRVASIPVFFRWASHSAAFPGPGSDEPDVQTPEEMRWRELCPCTVSSFRQPESGHLAEAHPGRPLGDGAVVAWLTDSDLGPRAGPFGEAKQGQAHERT